MGANSFGKRFVITTFGESHGAAMGVIIDGCPAGLEFDLELLHKELARRRPGSSDIVSARQEEDIPEVLSGVYDGRTLGTPIAIMVRNKDARSHDYNEIKESARRGHADDLWKAKFGHSDHRGGGRSSGRETVCRVMAGAVAKMLIKRLYPMTESYAYCSQIYKYTLSEEEVRNMSSKVDVDQFHARFPHSTKSEEIRQLLLEAKAEGKSYGGIINLHIDHTPQGLGQPVFHKFKADLASAMLSIGASSAISIGDGFSVAEEEGAEFHKMGHHQYGGIRGGITSGESVFIQIAFKPTSTVLDQAKKGRHDPCILPRAVPVVEAMANLVLVDHMLWSMGGDKV